MEEPRLRMRGNYHERFDKQTRIQPIQLQNW